MRKLFLNRWLCITAIVLMAVSCSDDEGDKGGNPVASFQFEADDEDFLTVHFTNFSQRAESYSWAFGDGGTSTDEDPSHTYANAGTYTVVLTASGNGKTSVKSQSVIVTDPGAALEALTGEVSKSWKLIRDVSTGRNPLQVGPADRSTIWWSYGGVEALGVRPCMLNDEFIFEADGDYEYKTNGDFWAEAMVLSGCQESLDANYTNGAAADLSAWNSGVHEFEYNATTQKLTVSGLGAFIGLNKVGTNAEIAVPQESVTYDVVKLSSEGPVDTLIVQSLFTTGDGQAAYWQFVLVHYENELQEPPIPGALPLPAFTYSAAGNNVTFTNTTPAATSYSWNFGDGTTSTLQNPTHTFANGIFSVVLTATNAVGNAKATQTLVLGTSDITLADLHGGGDKTWKLIPIAGAYRVGTAGTLYYANDAQVVADRACMFDDEFIFSNTMGYEYDSKGQVYAENYINNLNGCTNDAALTGIWAGFKSNATHTYTFNAPAGGNLGTITVNGTGAFLGFSKGFNGGEYANNGASTSLQTTVTYEIVNFANGPTTDYMEVRVQINTTGDPVWWSMLLKSDN